MKKKKNLSELDEKAWNSYIKNPTGLFDKDQKSLNKSFNKTRFRFDLHGYTLLDANKKITEVINFCIEKNYSELLLITGKGIHSNTEKNVFISNKLSKLRYSIPEYINSNSNLAEKILNISPAEMEDGGEGALILKLKIQ